MLRAIVVLLAIGSLSGQTPAGMLARLDGVKWESAPPAACYAHVPAQIEVHATDLWAHHCAETSGGIVRESFFYVFGEPAHEARLRVDLRPADESPATTARLLPGLQSLLTNRFGAPDHLPEMMEIGFRKLRYGQPVAGDHWHGGGLHYFLHANQTNPTPLGMRKGVQLVVMTDRLFAERMDDALALRAEGIFGEALEGDDPVRARLKAQIGAPYIRAIDAVLKAPADRPRLVEQTVKDLTAILSEADRGGSARRALCLMAADQVVNKLSQWLIELTPNGERESAEAPAVRRLLSPYGAKLGGMTHYGGLAYKRDLLWRVWREAPDTEGGELAFLSLQKLGWNTSSGESCPDNPDLFREVIVRGEAFLAAHPRSELRKYVIYDLAVAFESWWSIAHARADDPWVSAPPYPRRASNATEAGRALENAIRYYREIATLAPGTPEAASALRRLPRLTLGLETGQRRFFCSYC